MRVAVRAVCEGFTAHVLHENHLRFPLDDLELDHPFFFLFPLPHYSPILLFSTTL